MGIEETQKLVKVLTEDVLRLFDIDFEKVISEMKDLDPLEKLRFWAEIGESFVKILIKAQQIGLKESLISDSK